MMKFILSLGFGLILIGDAFGAAPTFISFTKSVFNTNTSPKTVVTNVTSGDILVFAGMNQTSSGSTLGISDDSSNSWTQQLLGSNVASHPYLIIWTATANATKTPLTVTLTLTGSGHFGGSLFVFNNSNGIGTKTLTQINAAAPSESFTTTQDNSAIVVFNDDWTPSTGPGTWLTNFGSFTDEYYEKDSTNYAVYMGYHPNAGVISTQTLGMSAPSGQNSYIGAIEVKGVAGGNVCSIIICGAEDDSIP